MEFVKHQEADGMCVDVFVCVCLCVHVWVCFGLKRGLTDGEGAWVDIYLVGRGGGIHIRPATTPLPPVPRGALGTHGCHLLTGAEGITEAQQHVLFPHTLHMIYIIQKMRFSTPQACGWVNSRCLLSKSRC